jgi:hypothetical protein
LIGIIFISIFVINNIYSQSIYGESETDIGVRGSSVSAHGVLGSSIASYGVLGSSSTGIAVYGSSNSSYGVYGRSTSGTGVRGFSSQHHGAIFRGNKDGGYADIVLQGSSQTGTGDNGVIMSDPVFPGSDIFMVANDAVVTKIDNNNNDSGNFYVVDGNGANLFQVDHNGNVSAQGSTINGSDRNRKEQITDVLIQVFSKPSKKCPYTSGSIWEKLEDTSVPWLRISMQLLASEMMIGRSLLLMQME